MTRTRNIGWTAAILMAALVVRVGWEGLQRAGGQDVSMRVVGIDMAGLQSNQTSPLIFEDRLPREVECPSMGRHISRFLILGGEWLALKPVVQAGSDRRWQALVAQTSKGGLPKEDGTVAVMGTVSCQPGAAGTDIRTELGINHLRASKPEVAAIRAAIQRAQGPAQARALLSIGMDGRARLVGLTVNDQRIDLRSWSPL